MNRIWIFLECFIMYKLLCAVNNISMWKTFHTQRRNQIITFEIENFKLWEVCQVLPNPTWMFTHNDLIKGRLVSDKEFSWKIAANNRIFFRHFSPVNKYHIKTGFPLFLVLLHKKPVPGPSQSLSSLSWEAGPSCLLSLPVRVFELL